MAASSKEHSMSSAPPPPPARPVRIPPKPHPVFLPRTALTDLVAALINRGYTVIAPMLRDGAISYQPITGVEQMAHGLKDKQDGGTYRLVPGDPDLMFEQAGTFDSPKRHLFPPAQRLYQFHLEKEQFVLDAGPPQVPKLAFFGVRPCDLAAIRVQDRVFGVGDPGTLRCESETYYTEARRQAFVIAVNCTNPGGTCFCVSMGTGPEAREGFDIALTELRGGFVIASGSPEGAEIVGALPTRECSSAELELAELKLRGAREHMGRKLETENLKKILDDSLEYPEYDDVAKRCLSCGNCTMVCPTCFCSTVSDKTDLGGAAVHGGKTTRTRKWESCFTHQFTYTTAGPDRNTIRGRYRHWLHHKLATWFDQFGECGCVGCGRCITWCPVGIDITAEATRLRVSYVSATAAAKEVAS
jgi:sulfhydrogenase subunit beta (sulfur reductase)